MTIFNENFISNNDDFIIIALYLEKTAGPEPYYYFKTAEKTIKDLIPFQSIDEAEKFIYEGEIFDFADAIFADDIIDLNDSIKINLFRMKSIESKLINNTRRTENKIVYNSSHKSLEKALKKMDIFKIYPSENIPFDRMLMIHSNDNLDPANAVWWVDKSPLVDERITALEDFIESPPPGIDSQLVDEYKEMLAKPIHIPKGIVLNNNIKQYGFYINVVDIS